jgi:hypothetical protein
MSSESSNFIAPFAQVQVIGEEKDNSGVSYLNPIAPVGGSDWLNS